MNSILPILIASALALFASRAFLAGSTTPASTFRASSSHVLVRRRLGTVYIAAIVVVAPWPLIVWFLSGQGESESAIFTGTVLFFSVSGAGVGILLYTLRKIFVSRDGIRIAGAISANYAWGDLREIETVVNGGIASVKFVFAKNRIRVDSTFDGFRELVRALEVWPTGNAKELGQKAARILAQWREDPKSTKK
jgi:hypothetical protein